MANTGYKINPQVIQYFTSGPNSGSEVSSSFNTTFNVGSNFTSSMSCGTQYNYRVFDPQDCVIPSFCIAPSIIAVDPSVCGREYNYTYTISYNINSNASEVPQSTIEYSLSPSFSGEVKGRTITNNISSSITTVSININNLNITPTNGNTEVYFRVFNICGGGIGNSTNSPIKSTKCTYVSPPTNYVSMLLHNALTPQGACEGGSIITDVCNINGFCGRIYYGDGISLQQSNKLYTYSNPPTLLTLPGYYSDGLVTRYWNGNEFTISNYCNMFHSF